MSWYRVRWTDLTIFVPSLYDCRMPSSRKRKRPSGPQERCQRSASSQSSSDDNRSGGRGCGRIITTIASVATTSKSHVSSHHAPHAAIAIASQMANDLKPEHKLPNRDILVSIWCGILLWTKFVMCINYTGSTFFVALLNFKLLEARAI